MAVIITYLIMNIIRTYAVYSFIDNFLQKRRWPAWALYFAYGTYYTVAAIIYLNPILFNFLHNVIMNLSFAFSIGFLYQASNRKRLLCSVFIYLLAIASDICAGALLLLVFNTSISELLGSNLLTAIGIFTSMILLLGIVKLVNPIFNRQEVELNRYYWFAVFLIPFGCIYTLYSLIGQLQQGTASRIFVLQTIIILFAINILVFFLYNKLLKEEATKYENLMLIQQNEAYEKQSLLIQDFQKDLSVQRHDLKNHLAIVKELTKFRKTDELENYIEHWLMDLTTITPGIHTDNSIVNAMINSKLYLAGLQETELTVNIAIPAELNIKRTDLTVILGNLLDNALEASTKVSPACRTIQCNISLHHNTLSINVTNSYNRSELNHQGEKFYTTKQDKKSHGIGLNRIRQIVEKYDGIFEIKLSEHKGLDIFITDVMLYL